MSWLPSTVVTLVRRRFALLALFTPFVASAQASAVYGRIQGIAFDSLLHAPIVGATVTVLESGKTTHSDANGRFVFDSVPTGTQVIALSFTDIDSLGMGTIGATTTVAEGALAHVNIATPSLRTLWTNRCNAQNRVGSDSGIVWGSVRNAASDSLAARAVVSFTWYDLNLGTLKTTRFKETYKEITTNDEGLYFACGLPSDVAVSTNAVDANSASGRVQYAIGARKLHRLELLVSTDMVIGPVDTTRAMHDSTSDGRARGSAGLVGTVTDGHHRPLGNAIVVVATADTSVRTDENGQFRLGALPSGTHTVQVRHLGLPPASQVVQLRPRVIANVSIEMSSANALTVFNVRAKSALRLEFEARREKGVGVLLDSTRLEHRPDMLSVLLAQVPFMSFKRAGSGFQVATGPCLKAFIDGMPAPFDMSSVLPPDHYRVVEVIRDTYVVPVRYKSDPCGVILYWTKDVKW